jgi:hypothetical protein
MNEKFSALKNSPEKENALVERYKQLIDEIIKTRALSDENKISLITHGNQALATLTASSSPKKTDFDPRMKDPKGTLTSTPTFIEKFIQQFTEEQRNRPENVPSLSIDEVIDSIKETGLDITDTEIGGMEINKLKSIIKGIIDADEWRRAEEKGLGFDDSDLVAEAEQTIAATKLAYTPHPPSQNSAASKLIPIKTNAEEPSSPVQQTRSSIGSKFAAIRKRSKLPLQEEGESEDKVLKPK